MTKTIQALETLKRVRKLNSDYAAAKALGRTTSAISKWRSGTQMDINSAARIAELSGQDAPLLVAQIGAESAKTDAEREAFKQLEADRLAVKGLMVLPELKAMIQAHPEIIDKIAQTFDDKEEKALFLSTMRKLYILCQIERLPYVRQLARPLPKLPRLNPKS